MKISYSQVETNCNELHALAKNMKEIIEKIELTGIKTTSGNTWNGAAADAYVSKLKSVTSNFDEIFSEIENSILFMANCSEGYQAIDQNVMREICSNLKISEPSLNTSKIFNGGQ